MTLAVATPYQNHSHSLPFPHPATQLRTLPDVVLSASEVLLAIPFTTHAPPVKAQYCAAPPFTKLLANYSLSASTLRVKPDTPHAISLLPETPGKV